MNTFSFSDINGFISTGPPNGRWPFSGNLWQPAHLSAHDRSHFTNAPMTASRFIRCPWYSPRLSHAALEDDGIVLNLSKYVSIF